MDILRPELVWVEGRCYRFFESDCWSEERGSAAYEEEALYESNYSYADDDTCDEDIEIKPADGGKLKHAFHVAKPFFPFIIGAKGTTKTRIATETKTSIRIPKQGQDGDVVIIGSDRKGIVTARRRIDMLVASSRKKLRPTHFISVPMNIDDIISGFNNFKNDVLRDISARGVDESIFQNPKKLHLTLGVLVLLDDDERQEAAEALEHCKKEVIGPILKKFGPIKVRLRGVAYMNDDPAEVNVLYAKIVENDILQEIADGIVNYFVQMGLMKREYDRVKLHVTLMNTSFRKNVPLNKKTRETFDATSILKVHENTEFSELVLESIHISQRHTTSDDGYYQATAEISVSDCY